MKKLFQKGYITLMSVLVIGTAGVAVAVSLLIFGLIFSQSSLASDRAAQARVIADACAEEALQQIREDDDFSGSGNLNIGLGDCAYSVSVGVDEARTVQAEGAVSGATRKVEVEIDQINPQINVTSWQEVGDF